MNFILNAELLEQGIISETKASTFEIDGVDSIISYWGSFGMML